VPQRPLEEEAFAQFPDDGMVALDAKKPAAQAAGFFLSGQPGLTG
jgi:hypothetical protein